MAPRINVHVVAIAEQQAIDSEWVELEDPRQVLALVTIDQRDAMATQGELGAEHVGARRAATPPFG